MKRSVGVGIVFLALALILMQVLSSLSGGGQSLSAGRQSGDRALGALDRASGLPRDASVAAQWNHPPAAPNAHGVTVGASYTNDVSPRLSSLPQITSKPSAPEGVPQDTDKNFPLPTDNRTGQTDTVVQRTARGSGPQVGSTLTAPPTTVRSFDGMHASAGSGTPPDTNGAVGPHYYVQTVNSAVQVFRKDGTSALGPLNINQLWLGAGGPCLLHNDGDPVVLYDHLADRWVITQFTVSPPYNECIAVSTSSDPTGTYYRYAFQLSTASLPDYPHLSVWPDGYYMSANMYVNDSAYGGPQPFVFDRNAMLAGQPATFQTFAPLGSSADPFLPLDVDGGSPPPANTPGLFAQTYYNGSDNLRIYKFSADWSPAHASTFLLSSTTQIAGWNSAYCGASAPARGRDCIPQPATTQKLDTIGSRLLFRAVYRNYGDHQSLFASHTVGVAPAGVRWYELRDPAGATPTLTQNSTYAPDAVNRWMGSIDADRAGNLALAYSASSTTLGPELRFAGRAPTDPLGQLTTGETTLSGTACAAMPCNQTGTDRWGDYSSLEVDPTDNCTFWYTSEYAKLSSGANWYTRIGAFRFPTCTNTSSTLAASGANQTTARSIYPVTVTVKDAAGDINSSYTGAVRLTSSDGAASLPANYTFTAGDSGSHTFPVKLNTPGAQTVTATDIATGTLTGSASVTVNPAPASMAITAPSSGNTGTSHAIGITVGLRKAANTLESSYVGTVHFTSNDPSAVLPADYSYTAGDAGTHAFSVAFLNPGAKMVTVTDTGNGALSATTAPINVTAISTFVAPATAGGMDANSCTTSSSPCLTIGAAIAKASSNGTISIAPGNYVERIELTQNLTVNGAGAASTSIDGTGSSGSVVTVYPGVIATLNGVTVKNGNSGGDGGGIANLGRLNASQIAVTNNQASNGSLSGGIMNETGATLTLLNSLVANNSLTCTGSCGGLGGGIYSRGDATIANTTIANNDASAESGNGGIRDRNGAMVLDNDTISGNTAGSAPGGGLAVSSAAINPPTLVNTIISGNTAGTGPDCNGLVSSGGHNLIGNGAACSGITNGSNGDQLAPASPGANLGALANNGGPTSTMALGAGSTAIDAGDNTACADPATVNKVDQRSVSRPQGAACDIGAFELVSAAPTVARVGDFTVSRLRGLSNGSRVLFRWHTTSIQGIAGFNLYAAKHRLNPRFIAAHAERSYRYTVKWSGRGPFTLQVVRRNGQHSSIHAR